MYFLKFDLNSQLLSLSQGQHVQQVVIRLWGLWIFNELPAPLPPFYVVTDTEITTAHTSGKILPMELKGIYLGFVLWGRYMTQKQ